MLQALTSDDIVRLLHNALKNPQGFGTQQILIGEDILFSIAEFSNGDARVALNTLEMVIINGDVSRDGISVSAETLEQCINKRSLLYDKHGRGTL